MIVYVLDNKLKAVKILDDLVENLGDAEVLKRDDGTWSLIVSPKIVEDIFSVKEKVDIIEHALETINDTIEN